MTLGHGFDRASALYFLGDRRRDRVLERLGYRVLRLDAELVVKHFELAVARVRSRL